MGDNKAEELKKAKREVHAVIEKLGDKVPPQARALAEEAIAKMKVDHLLPKEALGFTPELIEKIYQHGYNLFNAGKFKDALRVFSWLRELDITDLRYTFAIAACYQYLKQYLDAAANYMIFSYLDPLNPIPYFYMSDCFTKSGHSLSALHAIETTLVLSKNHPQYKDLREKAELELGHIKENIKENFNKKEEPVS